MKRMVASVILAAGMVVFMPAVAEAGAKAGQKIYKKKFRKACGFSGVRFARYHTRAEWKAIYEQGKFKEEVHTICPAFKPGSIKPAWWKHVYDFTYKYAKDGLVPEC